MVYSFISHLHGNECLCTYVHMYYLYIVYLFYINRFFFAKFIGEYCSAIGILSLTVSEK